MTKKALLIFLLIIFSVNNVMAGNRGIHLPRQRIGCENCLLLLSMTFFVNGIIYAEYFNQHNRSPLYYKDSNRVIVQIPESGQFSKGPKSNKAPVYFKYKSKKNSFNSGH